jgi:hypothetical protein
MGRISTHDQSSDMNEIDVPRGGSLRGADTPATAPKTAAGASGSAAPGAGKPAGTFEDFSSGHEWLELPIDIKLKVLKLLTVERDTPDEPAPCSRKR